MNATEDPIAFLTSQLEAAGAAIEKAIELGHPSLARALRAVVKVQTTIDNNAIYEPEDGHFDANRLLELLGVLADSMRQTAEALAPRGGAGVVATSHDFEQRSRSLCADVLTIQIDGNLHQYVSYLRELQAEARSLLTGEPNDFDSDETNK